MINLMNEWGSHTLTSNAYASAYNAALEIVRQVYSGTVIIDAPGWGHEATVAANAITGESFKFVIKCALRLQVFTNKSIPNLFNMEHNDSKYLVRLKKKKAKKPKHESALLLKLSHRIN